ncbi:MAG: hypothetical protein K0V04_41110 [Deltaproteobacteria bacterium]|nr:hypothetical protein [Deltaproteobacteria bacterium]
MKAWTTALVTAWLVAACSTVAPEAGSSPDPTSDDSAAGPGDIGSLPAVATPAVRPAIAVGPGPGGPVARARAETDAKPTVEVAPDPLEAVVAKLRVLEADPAPERTTNDKHYIVSNERRLDLYRPEIDDRGGIILGVGSDQNYLMAAWAKAELLVVVDFDQQVVDLHTVHGALMAASATVEDFRRMWTEGGLDDAHAAVRAAVDGRRRGVELVALYDEARPVVEKRLRKLARRYEELGVHSYLDTPEHYRYIADLHARGRVVAVRGDFTLDGVLRDVAEVLDEHEQSLSVLYLSNIEQYFTYKRPFKDNMLALPLAADAMVLRTLPGKPAGFQYILQRGEDFQAWMKAPRVWSVYAIRGLIKGEHLVAGERFMAGAPPQRARG